MFARPLVSLSMSNTTIYLLISKYSDWTRISDRTDDNLLQWIGSVVLRRHTRPFVWQRTANESFLFIIRYSHCVFINIFFYSLHLKLRDAREYEPEQHMWDKPIITIFNIKETAGVHFFFLFLLFNVVLLRLFFLFRAKGWIWWMNRSKLNDEKKMMIKKENCPMQPNKKPHSHGWRCYSCTLSTMHVYIECLLW